MDEPAYELHAWVDVFIPGIGWLGLDPSHGIFTGICFPIASSAHFENTMPVSGGIRECHFKLLTHFQ
jgi:transglutaminase-like putative cysteine protease